MKYAYNNSESTLKLIGLKLCYVTKMGSVVVYFKSCACTWLTCVYMIIKKLLKLRRGRLSQSKLSRNPCLYKEIIVHSKNMGIFKVKTIQICYRDWTGARHLISIHVYIQIRSNIHSQKLIWQALLVYLEIELIL